MVVVVEQRYFLEPKLSVGKDIRGNGCARNIMLLFNNQIGKFWWNLDFTTTLMEILWSALGYCTYVHCFKR